ncbi:MAG: DUF4079 family protein [Nitrospinota bacterium]
MEGVALPAPPDPPWLPFVHPVWQATTLLLGLGTLALGLRLRRHRRSRGMGPSPGLLRAHLRAAISFLCLLSAGYLLGPATMGFVLGKPLYRTAHAYFASGTFLLFLLTGYYGLRLYRRRGDKDARELHAYCAFLATFVALAAAFMGFGLLP